MHVCSPCAKALATDARLVQQPRLVTPTVGSLSQARDGRFPVSKGCMLDPTLNLELQTVLSGHKWMPQAGNNCHVVFALFNVVLCCRILQHSEPWRKLLDFVCIFQHGPEGGTANMGSRVLQMRRLQCTGCSWCSCSSSLRPAWGSQSSPQPPLMLGRHVRLFLVARLVS